MGFNILSVFKFVAAFLLIPPEVSPIFLEILTDIGGERHHDVNTFYYPAETTVSIPYEGFPRLPMGETNSCGVSLTIRLLKDRKKTRTACLFKDTDDLNIFEKDSELFLEELSMAVSELHSSVQPVRGFIRHEPSSLVKGYIIKNQFYGSIRMYDHFRLYHIVVYVEPISNVELYSPEANLELPQKYNAIIFEYIPTVQNALWVTESPSETDPPTTRASTKLFAVDKPTKVGGFTPDNNNSVNGSSLHYLNKAAEVFTPKNSSNISSANSNDITGSMTSASYNATSETATSLNATTMHIQNVTEIMGQNTTTIDPLYATIDARVNLTTGYSNNTPARWNGTTSNNENTTTILYSKEFTNTTISADNLTATSLKQSNVSNANVSSVEDRMNATEATSLFQWINITLGLSTKSSTTLNATELLPTNFTVVGNHTTAMPTNISGIATDGNATSWLNSTQSPPDSSPNNNSISAVSAATFNMRTTLDTRLLYINESDWGLSTKRTGVTYMQVPTSKFAPESPTKSSLRDNGKKGSNEDITDDKNGRKLTKRPQEVIFAASTNADGSRDILHLIGKAGADGKLPINFEPSTEVVLIYIPPVVATQTENVIATRSSTTTNNIASNANTESKFPFPANPTQRTFNSFLSTGRGLNDEGSDYYIPPKLEILKPSIAPDPTKFSQSPFPANFSGETTSKFSGNTTNKLVTSQFPTFPAGFLTNSSSDFLRSEATTTVQSTLDSKTPFDFAGSTEITVTTTIVSDLRHSTDVSGSFPIIDEPVKQDPGLANPKEKEKIPSPGSKDIEQATLYLSTDPTEMSAVAVSNSMNAFLPDFMDDVGAPPPRNDPQDVGVAEATEYFSTHPQEPDGWENNVKFPFHSTTVTSIAESLEAPDANRKKRTSGDIINFNNFFGENLVPDEDDHENLGFRMGKEDSKVFDMRRETALTCEICLWIQPHFAEKFSLGGNLLLGVSEVVDIIRLVDWTIRAMDFNMDNSPENIGMTVGKILLSDKISILHSEGGARNRRKRSKFLPREYIMEGPGDNLAQLVAKFEDIDEDLDERGRLRRKLDFEEDILEYYDVNHPAPNLGLLEMEKVVHRLKNFSRDIHTISPYLGLENVIPQLQLRFQKCCAILGFIYHDLSPAFAATSRRGLCSNHNVGLISGFLNGKKIAKYDVFRGIMHTLGHLFGADHDNVVNSECFDQDISDFLNPFPLHPIHQLNVGMRPNSLRYSPCSIDQITMFLASGGASCLKEARAIYCGNGVVEDGEECDCGSLGECYNGPEQCCGERESSNKCKFLVPGKHRCFRRSFW